MTSIFRITNSFDGEVNWYSYDNKSGGINIIPVRIDLYRILASNDAESKSGGRKYRKCITVHFNVALVLLLERTEAECGNWGLL